MDRFAENTLRTIAIVLISIFVILGCLLLLAVALCFGAIAQSSHNPNDQTSGGAIALGAFVAAIILVCIGVFIISTLAKGMVSATSATTAQPYSLTPPPVTKPLQSAPPPLSDEGKLDQALASLEARTKRTDAPKIESPNRELPNREPLPAHAQRPVDVRHLSPASRTAIQQLAYAIIAKVVAEIALGIVGWYGALGVPRFARVPFPVYRFGFMAWGLAAIAPHLVLLYALARRPGPRAFAYALVIPSLHLLFGIFGHSAFLAFILRAGQTAAPLLSIAPWFLDILILYLAWKAIRQTGIEPNPPRLITASVVIFLYTSMLPPLVLILNQWR